MDARRKPTVLIADSQEQSRCALGEILKEDYRILTAADKTEALEVLQKQREEIALVLADITLPASEGFEILREIKGQEKNSSLPVIVISEEKDFQLVIKAYEQGAADYLSRPFHPLMVRRRISGTLLLFAERKEPGQTNSFPVCSGKEAWGRIPDTSIKVTSREIKALLEQLKKLFDVVRLVDVTQTLQVELGKDGRLKELPHLCYSVWNKEHRCENCISAKAFSQHSRLTKLEFAGEDIYQVIAKYVEVDGRPCVLEMVTRLEDEALLNVCGKRELIEKINSYNKELYVDPLTGAYNRRYLDNQLLGLEQVAAVAMIDADNFKSINDTYGHQAGDAALKSITESISSCLREADMLIRYGGDEFLLLFPRIGETEFQEILERIRQQVQKAKVEGYPEIRLSVSIGGVHTAMPVNEAVHQADRLMYEEKGRSR